MDPLARQQTLFEKMSRLKSVDLDKKSTKTNSELSRSALTMFGVGGTIGAGIFALTGIAA
jgi:amino acid permease